jgi:phosphoribosylglycinamide formyltransferase-1
MKRVGVLVSGRGSNLQALIGAAQEGQLGGEVAVVVSNVAAAPALDKARAAGVPTFVCDHRGQPREEHDRAVLQVLRDHGADLVCLAGYMRLLSAPFLRALPHRVVNIHPSLLPSFPGLDAQRQAWEHGVKVAGATVHLVEEALDAGPIVMQEAVSVRPDDTPASLAARILEAEHRLYPRAVRLLLGGRWHLEGRRFVTEAEPEPA